MPTSPVRLAFLPWLRTRDPTTASAAAGSAAATRTGHIGMTGTAVRSLDQLINLGDVNQNLVLKRG
jgi:hypothetical protein